MSDIIYKCAEDEILNGIVKVELITSIKTVRNSCDPLQ